MSPAIQDKYGRRFRTLRLSLTDNCNFQCLYCAPNSKGGLASRFKKDSKKEQWPKAAQYAQYVKAIHAVNPLDTVRLTGGEPTLYPFLPELIFLIKGLGIRRVSMTSNAFRLKKLIPDLKDAGLDSINVSLDALQPQIMRRMSRHPHAEEALASIESLLALRQECVLSRKKKPKPKLELKVNCTVWRGINHSEIVPMLAYFGKRGVPLRYLELMNMGHLYKNFKDYLYTQDEILRDLALHYDFYPLERKQAATASYWQSTEKWIFGIIANHSSPFCSDCDRLRMDSQGRLYGCLSSTHSIPFPKEQGLLEDCLKTALAQKQALNFQGSQLSMQAIGG